MKSTYLFKEENTDNIKIGFSGNPKGRLETLQVGNSRKLIVIDTVQCSNCDLLENKLHEIFKNKRIRGEWYNLNTEDIRQCMTKLRIYASHINNKLYTREMFNRNEEPIINITEISNNIKSQQVKNLVVFDNQTDSMENVVKNNNTPEISNDIVKDNNTKIKIPKDENLYHCKSCNYSTLDKSNFRRHIRSQIHQRNMMTSGDKTPITIKTNKRKKKKIFVHKCECGKNFSHQPSLSRHKRTCKYIEQENDTNELKKGLSDIKSILMQLIETNNTTL